MLPACRDTARLACACASPAPLLLFARVSAGPHTLVTRRPSPTADLVQNVGVRL